uniref:Uncharacterized protein n=1 Tax=Euplotes vanleeuwenhoeki TaxID=2794224 RepID=A0A7T1FV16_9SPIT|nr:hypothetical protein KQ443_mgp15 [Euplotes vanleeuwenhoeki]QPM99263.1 hypothetical protein MitoLV_35 [Euplotes vanleeuwenhoeki]
MKLYNLIFKARILFFNLMPVVERNYTLQKTYELFYHRLNWTIISCLSTFLIYFKTIKLIYFSVIFYRFLSLNFFKYSTNYWLIFNQKLNLKLPFMVRIFH